MSMPSESRAIQLPWEYLTYQLIAVSLGNAVGVANYVTMALWGPTIRNAGVNMIVLVVLVVVGLVGPRQLAREKIPRYIPGFSHPLMKQGSPGRIAHSILVIYFLVAIFVIIANFLLWISWLISLLWSAPLELAGALGILIWYWRDVMSKVNGSSLDMTH